MVGLLSATMKWDGVVLAYFAGFNDDDSSEYV